MSELLLQAETAAGRFVRRVLPARRLHPEEPIGDFAEAVIRASGAVWGLRDFVFKAVLASKGRRVRERGDVLLLCGAWPGVSR